MFSASDVNMKQFCISAKEFTFYHTCFKFVYTKLNVKEYFNDIYNVATIV